MSKINKLHNLAESVDSLLLKEAQERIKNRSWLKYSQKIAVVVLHTIKSKKISQKELADKMDVSPQYVNKLLKGREKLNLETIAKLEEALNISLIEISMPKKTDKPKGKLIKIDFKRNISRGNFDTFKIAK